VDVTLEFHATEAIYLADENLADLVIIEEVVKKVSDQENKVVDII
jgi:hypothetical protein